MKIILLTGTILTSNEESLDIYKKINNIIVSNGCKVYTPLDTIKFKGSTQEKYIRAMDLVKNCDAVIAEMSSISTGQGMEIQEAVQEGKNILVIAKEGSKVSSLVEGCPNVTKIIFYNKIKDIETSIIDFINNY